MRASKLGSYHFWENIDLVGHESFHWDEGTIVLKAVFFWVTHIGELLAYGAPENIRFTPIAATIRVWVWGLGGLRKESLSHVMGLVGGYICVF